MAFLSLEGPRSVSAHKSQCALASVGPTEGPLILAAGGQGEKVRDLFDS